MPLPKHAELFFGLQLTKEQKHYADAIFDKNIVFVNARAGSGKTTVAVGCAKLIYEASRRTKPLLYLFSPVEERTMGYRKGGQKAKEEDYLLPLKDALVEIGENPTQAIVDDEAPNKYGTAWVIAKSHTFLRGSTVKNCTVIIAEAQNFTKRELKKVLTRLADSCTVIVEGHDKQCDLPEPSDSGFVPYIDWFKGEPYVAVCTLTKNFRGKISQRADEMPI